jgi:diguanylate cyclase (GGDEF)-like protein
MMKLLIVDDSPDALDVARVRLAKEGLEILCADGGVSGLELAHREKPDLILLDLEMPDMSGFDVCRALKADVDLCMIPVLFVSASSTAEDKVRGLDLGAVDYVTKPFDAFELRARVRAALRTKHLQDLLIEHAHIDPLTGLPNRRALMENLQREWSRMQRYGNRLSFIMADVDHFKRVNDTYGHHIGDKLLQELAHVIEKQCRQTDLPCRYGGEEFAIVVPEPTEGGAASLAERCRQEVAKIQIAAGNEMVGATVSFGVADATHAPSSEILVIHADNALYQAKNSGRNMVVSYNANEPSPIVDFPATVVAATAPADSP